MPARTGDSLSPFSGWRDFPWLLVSPEASVMGRTPQPFHSVSLWVLGHQLLSKARHRAHTSCALMWGLSWC